VTVPLLAVQGVSKRFAGIEALRDVSLEVWPGEIVAVIGPNGAGKTTLLNIICGSLRSGAGSVRLHGADIHGRPPHAVSRMGIARTFQTVELFRRLTVRENVVAGAVTGARVGVLHALLGLWSRGPRCRMLNAEADRCLTLVGLTDMADQPAGALSAGQQRLLTIARALATGGELLVLDEPGAGLNQVEKGQLAEVIGSLRADGKTIIFVEHDMTLVGRLADRLIVLADGRRIAEGSPEAIRRDPRVVEAYLGVQVLPARSAAATNGRRATAAFGPCPSDGAFLTVREVEVAYGGLRALRGVTFEVRRGEIVAVVGGNGAGKSTLLKTIMRVVSNQRGQLLFDGFDLTRLRPEGVVRAGISLVPEGRELFPSLTVWDNLLLGRYAKGRSWRVGLENATEQVFTLFPVLRERRRQLAGTLSGGQGQMLAIGRALMSGPRLLMLDEPSLGLAPQIVAQIMGRLVDLRALGLTVVLVEQNARAALEIADRGYVLETGRVAVVGPGRDLLTDPEITSAYLGRASEGARLAAPPISSSGQTTTGVHSRTQKEGDA
jgi:ABC-type branched-subunit amino acid transport system ATPase component